MKCNIGTYRFKKNRKSICDLWRVFWCFRTRLGFRFDILLQAVLDPDLEFCPNLDPVPKPDMSHSHGYKTNVERKTAKIQVVRKLQFNL